MPTSLILNAFVYIVETAPPISLSCNKAQQTSCSGPSANELAQNKLNKVPLIVLNRKEHTATHTHTHLAGPFYLQCASAHTFIVIT